MSASFPAIAAQKYEELSDEFDKRKQRFRNVALVLDLCGARLIDEAWGIYCTATAKEAFPPCSDEAKFAGLSLLKAVAEHPGFPQHPHCIRNGTLLAAFYGQEEKLQRKLQTDSPAKGVA